MKVAVLGCGPAGLMAAHAAASLGVPTVVMSRKRKSPLYGAQYLHAPIPNVTDRDARVTVDYRLVGSVDDYRRKVYGRWWDGTVSPEDLEEEHEAWDIRSTYDRLWDMYQDAIVDVDVDGPSVKKVQEHFDLVVNTIPLNSLCMNPSHVFKSQEIMAAGDAPDLGIQLNRMYTCPPNMVVCNGEDSPLWYRMSNIFGHMTVEWPGGSNPPVSTAAVVRKPISNNCDCLPGVLLAGRYGSWTKGVLSHDSYRVVGAYVERKFWR